METRSRKRAEAKSQRPAAVNTSSAADKSSSDGKKRARVEPPQSTPSAPAPTPTRRLTRSSARMESPAGASAAKKEEIDKKGKREATVDRVREQEREPDRREILSDYYEEEESGEDDYADDGDDEDLGVRSHHYPPAAFEGRLREFTGYYDVMPPSAPQNGRMKEILSRLRDNGDDFSQTEALTELCNVLSMATENSLAGFSLESFVPVLVGLLNREPLPDVMLLAARALTHLCNALPSSCSAVVHHCAIPAFCARLLTIEYMDLAEQQQPPRPYPTTPNGYSSMPLPGPPGTQPQQQPQMMNPSEGFVSHRRRYSAGAAKEVEPTHRCRGFPGPQRLSQPAAWLAVGVQQSPDEYVNELEGAVRGEVSCESLGGQGLAQPPLLSM